MRFRVSRTSDWRGDKPPVEGAVRGEKDSIGVFTWTLEVPDLDALLDIAGGCDVIVSGPKDDPALEVYDDYRE